MKNKVLFFTIISLCLLIGGEGCDKEKEDKFKVYENHEISACGINDPLNNIKWINEYCRTHSRSFEVEIFLYKNKEESIEYIVIETSTPNEPDRSPSIIHVSSIYSCGGELLFFYGTEGPKPDQWEEFFMENEKISELWSVKLLN